MGQQRKRLCLCLLAALFATVALRCTGQTKGSGTSTSSGGSGGSGGSGKPAGTATSAGGGSSGGAGGAKGGGPAVSGGSGGGGGSAAFAIETEMLAYKSLQSDSEAIACDIAGFLYSSPGERLTPNGPTFEGAKGEGAKGEGGKGEGGKGQLEVQAVKTACANAPSGSPTGVIILSSSGSTLGNFQAWRVDMATMRSLQAQANAYCPAQAQTSQGIGTMGVPGMSIPTPSDIEGMLQMFATTEAATGTTGTIEDQALMDGVGRQLRALNVPVLMPDSFSPYSFGGMDFAQFPLLKSLMGLMDSRARVKACADKENDAAKKADEGAVVANIDAFVTSAVTVPAGSDAGTPPPIAGALSADGFAQAIGVGPDGSFAEASVWKHVLLVKALESGGSELTQGNLIFGSKIHFSGGAVATYSLFSLDKTSNGRLACSGNVYDYGGYVRPKDLAKKFVKTDIDPRNQLIFLRGGCATSE
jgi:hypothetical protein